MTPRPLSYLLPAIVACCLAAAWWPFRLDLPERLQNGAAVVDGAVSFESPGLLEWEPAPFRPASPWGLELRVRPSVSDQIGPARILEIGLDHRRMNLMVGQSGTAVVVRVRRRGSDDTGAPPLVGLEVFEAGRATEITFRDTGARIELLVDGVLIDSRPATGSKATWSPDLSLTLGDSPVGGRAWLGRIERAEVWEGGSRLDLLETAASARPESILRVSERIRIVWEHRLFPPTNALDVLLNVLAFLPLGFLLAASGSRRLAFVVALCLSAAMELGQIGIVDRVPSVLDLVLNVAGAWLGALLAARCSSHGDPPS